MTSRSPVDVAVDDSPTTAGRPFVYRAFLSYSHRDTVAGDAFHRALEHYVLPREIVGKPGLHGPVPERIGRIFRDRYDLEAHHSLGEAIEAGLKQSEALIVLCSPNSAKSPYVGAEIARFKQLGRSDRIYAVIVDGEPGDPARECFHPNLRRIVGPDGRLTDELSEPIAADLRPQGDGEDLAKLKVIAGLMGVDLDDLRRREAEESRRRARFWRRLTIGMSVVAAIAIGSSGVAWYEYRAKQVALVAEQAALAKNETMLTRTLDRARSLIERSVTSADQFGLPVQVSFALLDDTRGILDDIQAVGLSPTAILGPLIELSMTQADMYAKVGDVGKQVEAAEQARTLALFEAQRAPADANRQHTLADAWLRVGHAFSHQRKLADALTAYGTAAEIRESRLGGLSATDPRWLAGLADTHRWIGVTQRRRGSLLEAIASFEKSLAASARLREVGGDGTRVVETWVRTQVSLADAKGALGRREEARRAATEALTMVRARRAEEGADSVSLQRSEGNILIVLGDIDRAVKDHAAALASYQASLDLRQPLMERDPRHVSIATEVAFAKIKIGEVLAAAPAPLGDLARAGAFFDAAGAAYEAIIKATPDNRAAARQLTDALDGIGDLQERRGLYDAMRTTFARKLEVAEQIRAQDPNIDSVRLVANAEMKIAEAEVKSARYPEAVTVLTRAVGHYRWVRSQTPDNATARRDLALALEALGDATLWVGDLAASLAHGQEALALREDLAKMPGATDISARLLASARQGLAATLVALEKPAEALALVEPAIVFRRSAKGPSNVVYERDFATALETAGRAHAGLGAFGPALAALDEARAIRQRHYDTAGASPQPRRTLALSWQYAANVRAANYDCPGALDALRQARTLLESMPAADLATSALKRQLVATLARTSVMEKACPVSPPPSPPAPPQAARTEGG